MNRLRQGRRVTDEAGYSLIEVMLAILVAATVLIALLMFLITLLRASDNQTKTSAMRNRAVTASEVVDAMAYKKCAAGQTTSTFKASFAADGVASENDYWSVAGPLADGYEVEILGVEFLESSDPSIKMAEFAATCPAGADQGVQRIAISVTKPGRSEEGVVHLLKRNTECSSHVLASVPATVPEGENGIGEC